MKRKLVAWVTVPSKMLLLVSLSILVIILMSNVIQMVFDRLYNSTSLTRIANLIYLVVVCIIIMYIFRYIRIVQYNSNAISDFHLCWKTNYKYWIFIILYVLLFFWLRLYMSIDYLYFLFNTIIDSIIIPLFLILIFCKQGFLSSINYRYFFLYIIAFFAPYFISTSVPISIGLIATFNIDLLYYYFEWIIEKFMFISCAFLLLLFFKDKILYFCTTQIIVYTLLNMFVKFVINLLHADYAINILYLILFKVGLIILFQAFIFHLINKRKI